MMSYILTQLFLNRRYEEMDNPKGDTTQSLKWVKKIEEYLDYKEIEKSGGLSKKEIYQRARDDESLIKAYDAYRAYYTQLSRITRQMWRFLEGCFDSKSSIQLYQRQLWPLVEKYL